ncbi:hypothetical protein QR77_08100 [Streptomyces sp. 150FB]|nr:hypothetical protein QR77_08100 [Streptomyces sp. 150FB]
MAVCPPVDCPATTGRGKPEPVEYGDHVGDIRGPRDVPGVPLAPAVAALVDSDDPVVRLEPPGRLVLLARVPGQAVRQDHGPARAAPVTADQPHSVAYDGTRHPGGA